MPNPLLCALTSAFALVATADGELAPDEVERFGALLRKQSLPTARLPAETIEKGFADALRALHHDPFNSRRAALQTIADIGDNPVDSRIVVAVARVALHADAVQRQSEHRTMLEICAALGLPDEAANT